MTKKNSYPGGVKLTATKARAVAMQEFGTTKVVSAELAFATGQTLKFLNPDTLQDDYNALERYCKRAQRDDLKDWVLTNGVDYCCEEVKRIWERG